MSPKGRSEKSRDLPDHLFYAQRDGAYIYTRPDGRRFSLGAQRNRAIRITKRLNAELYPKEYELEAAILGRALGIDREAPLSQVIERFRAEFLPDRRYSAVTLAEYERLLSVIDIALGDNPARLISIQQVAKFLDEYPPTMSNRYRALLGMVFRFAIAKGIVDSDPAAATLKKAVRIQRQRLTLPVYRTIHAAAEPWFQNALDLALQTLQRREDVAGMRFDALVDGRLLVRQKKVERHRTGQLAIRVTPIIKVIIDRCRDDLVSPFLVHRRPARMRREYLSKKAHWAQVAPEMLTREFKRLRDELALCDGLAPAARPTFHEIRALGAKLYEDAGINPQTLLGHTTEKQTRVYLDRHKVKWVEVDAGLEIPA